MITKLHVLRGGCLAVEGTMLFVLLAGCAPEKRARLASDVRPTLADVVYGPAARHRLDFYQAAGDRPAPVAAYFHGGGFVSGDKEEINPGLVAALNKSGIHFASINYRYVDGQDVLFPAPLLDGARAVQFLRTKAGQWNIDPDRIACFGGSAGAGISLWVGFHDDLADPQNADPVLRESSRIAAVGSLNGQSTYNPIVIRELVGGRAWQHPSMYKLFGLRDAEQALDPTPEQRRLYDVSAAITWLTADDPPVFMAYDEPDGPLSDDAKPGDGIHHPAFGRMLKERMDQLGVENVFINLDGGKVKDVNAIGEMLEFFERRLGVEGAE